MVDIGMSVILDTWGQEHLYAMSLQQNSVELKKCMV